MLRQIPDQLCGYMNNITIAPSNRALLLYFKSSENYKFSSPDNGPTRKQVVFTGVLSLLAIQKAESKKRRRLDGLFN